MAKKKITLDVLAASLAKMDAHVRKGLASIGKRFTSVEARMDRGFAATADDIAHATTRHNPMAT